MLEDRENKRFYLLIPEEVREAIRFGGPHGWSGPFMIRVGSKDGEDALECVRLKPERTYFVEPADLPG